MYTLTFSLMFRKFLAMANKAVVRLLMCRPTFFNVKYEINPWMRPGDPVNVGKATRQWETLKRTIEVAVDYTFSAQKIIQNLSIFLMLEILGIWRSSGGDGAGGDQLYSWFCTTFSLFLGR